MCYVWTLLLLVQFPGVVDSIQAVTDGPYQATCYSADEYLPIDELSGTLREPQNETLYGNDKVVNCRWTIEDLNNKDVIFFNLTYLNIDVDRYGDCTSSSGLRLEDTFLITIHDSIDYCGNISSPILDRGISNSRNVDFSTSRESPIGTGFELHWFYAPICSNGPVVIPIDSVTAELTSMSWPWYDGTDDCQYHISVSDKSLRLTVSELNVVDNSCSTDYLEVVNPDDPTEIWRKFCKDMPNPRYFYLPGPAALIIHHRVSESGFFRISWEKSDIIGRTAKQRMCDAAAYGCGAGVGVVIILVIALKCAKSSPYYYKRGEVSIGSQTISAQPTPPIPPTVSLKALPHIMISYQWDVKEAVLKFKEQLVKAGYRAWIDVEWMHRGASTFDAMTDAIENAAVVVPVLTAKYQESVSCRREIEFADKSKKPIVAVRFEKKFKPTKWLSFLLGNSLWHDLSNPETYHDQLQNFLDAIEVNGAIAKIESHQNNGQFSIQNEGRR